MVVKTILIGFIQGLTEFLPVSSSGHIALMEHFLNLSSDNLVLETAVHFGTLLSLLVFFRKRIFDLIKGIFIDIKERNYSQNSRFAVYVVIGIMPAALAALIFYDFIESAFSNLLLVGIFFIITGTILFSTRFIKHNHALTFKSSLITGIVQIFALLPGISRSGITISGSMMSGTDGKSAADFSFFMAIPLILAGFLKEMTGAGWTFSMPLIAGILASFISGYIAVFLLYKIISRGYLHVFSYYLWPLGISVIIYSVVR